MKITKQKSSDKIWLDESANPIPYDRTTKFERAAETSVHKMANDANKLSEALSKYKDGIKTESERLYALFVAENGQIGKGKGGATFYNFDRSIKVTVSIHDQIRFDENTIELAKEKLDELLSDGLDGAKAFIKPLVMDAFKQSNGRLDTKQVLGIKKHQSRIDDPRFDEACRLIDKSIRRPSSKEYFQVWVKDDAGEYVNIQLNFAAL